MGVRLGWNQLQDLNEKRQHQRLRKRTFAHGFSICLQWPDFALQKHIAIAITSAIDLCNHVDRLRAHLHR
jgi:hypothetical protein